MTITIPLSKTGKKHVGKYEVIIDDIDSDLAELNWTARNHRKTVYAHRIVRKNNAQRVIQLHRIIMGRKLGRDLLDSEQVDHADGDGLNNTRPNLRLATGSQNGWNKGMLSSNTSGYKGVSKTQGNKWRARIAVDGKTYYLGNFDTAELANAACIAKREELHGEFANHGTPK